MPPTIHADTPEDLRQVLLDYFKFKHLDATKRVNIPNQSFSTRQVWTTRARVLSEAALFLLQLKIVPKTSVIIPPPPDHTGTFYDNAKGTNDRNMS